MNYQLSVILRIVADSLIFIGSFSLASFYFGSDIEKHIIVIFLFVYLSVHFINGTYTKLRGELKKIKTKKIILSHLITFVLLVNIGSFLSLKNSVSLFTALTLLTISANLYLRYLNPISYLKRRKINININYLTNTNDKTLIIGGGGYIGSSVTKNIIENGGRVRVLDKFKFGEHVLDNLKRYSNLEIINDDYSNSKALYNCMYGCNKVIHLGGLVGDPACSVNPAHTIDQNLISTKSVIEIATSLEVNKFIFASSCSVYGFSDEIMFEKSSLSPVSLYAKTKIGSEEILKEYASNKLKIDVLRFSTIFGFSERIRFDLVVNLFVKMAFLENKINVIDGEQWRPFVHVLDAAEAVCRSHNIDFNDCFNIFNIGHPNNNFTISQIAQLVKENFSDVEVEHSSSQIDKRNYRVNFDKMMNELNFNPNWTVDDGIKQMKFHLENMSNDELLNIDNNISFSNYKTELNVEKDKLKDLGWLYGSIDS